MSQVFYSGDVVEITGTKIKERYRGHRGEIKRWSFDNWYIVVPFSAPSKEILLHAKELKLIQR